MTHNTAKQGTLQILKLTPYRVGGMVGRVSQGGYAWGWAVRGLHDFQLNRHRPILVDLGLSSELQVLLGSPVVGFLVLSHGETVTSSHMPGSVENFNLGRHSLGVMPEDPACKENIWQHETVQC